MDSYQEKSLQKDVATCYNWEYDPIARQLSIRTKEAISIFDEGAIQLLKNQLPPAETGHDHPVSADDEDQFAEEVYDAHLSSLYIFLSNFWKRKEEGQTI